MLPTSPVQTRSPSSSEPGGKHSRLPVRVAWPWLHATGITPYLGVAAILVAVMWPAWVSTDRLIVSNDTLVIHYPYFVLWRDLLAAGEWPFWNPYTFSGIPAFATLQAGYGYPPHWLLTPLPPIVAVNWLVGLHVLLAGLGAAWCAGRLGASWHGRVLAGCAYALGSAMVARMWAGHLSFLETNAWLPLATGLAFEVGRRHGVLRLAPVVGLMALAGQPEIVIFSLWWLPLWGLAASLRRGQTIRTVSRVCLGTALGLGLAAFQFVPVAYVASISNRQAGMSWDFQTGASLPPWHLLELVGPLIFGDPRNSYWPGPGYEWHERLLYVGIVPLLAAGCARGPWRWICWGGAALAIGLAFGRYLPGYELTQYVPGYAALRIPSKHLTLAALALALAAGLGLPRLGGVRVAAILLALAVGVAIAGVVLADASAVPLLPSRANLEDASTAALLPVLVTLVLAGLVALVPWVRTRHSLLLALAVGELVLVLMPFRTVRADPRMVETRADFPAGYARVGTLDGDPIVANYGPVLRVQQPGGFVSLFSGRYMALLTGVVNPGVVLSAPSDATPILHLLGYEVVVDRQRRTVSVFDPAPARAWVAHCVWPGGVLQVRQPDFPRQSCIARESARTRDPIVHPSPARIVDEGPGRLTVEASGPGWLVTTQPWYPGWRAVAAGRALVVEPVDGALVGVSLPDGEHRVEVWYRPTGLEIGLVLTIIAMSLLAAIWWWDRRVPVRRAV